MKSKQTRLHFHRTFDELLKQGQLDPRCSVLIFDRKLERVSPRFKAFAKRFPIRYAVNAGESVKELAAFAGHVKKLSQLVEEIPARRLTVVAVGGGSLGDFAGFFASVFKRGVGLLHIPTTWLAAIDSSHGGKTALNVSGVKNQIGTFYPAKEVFLVKEILFSQDERRAFDAMGELAKIALITGGGLAKRLSESELTGHELLWNFLKPAVSAKMGIVRVDPLEQTGHRQVLNLGHTLGHAFEAKYGWPHGFSVAQGLFFAIEMSEATGMMKSHDADRALEFLSGLGLTPARPTRKFRRSELVSLLRKDKKSSLAASVTFIALRRIGRVERVEIPIDEIVHEAARQGWVQ
jgi:3-dehydroquinate synthase